MVLTSCVLGQVVFFLLSAVMYIVKKVNVPSSPPKVFWLYLGEKVLLKIA